MTKPYVIVPDTNSAMKNMEINVAASVSNSSSLFSTTTSSAATASAAIAKSKQQQHLQNLDIKTGSRMITSWVDSMKASSPTHIKSNPASYHDPDDQSCWIQEHPSALEMFEQIIKASKGKQIVMFLDYDGTLSPIVDDPDRAFMSHPMRATVRKVAKYFPTAIVSGRCRNKVYGFVRLSELYYAGSHGMDIIGPSKATKYSNKGVNEPVPFLPAKEFLPVIDEVQKVLVEKIKSIPGAKVENNKFCISVHFRCVDEKKWGELARQVKSVMEDYPKLRLSTGRKVLEIRPIISWDKGKALEFLLESLGYANSTNVFPVYIGDDQTDEDAFKVLQKRGQGFGILVSKTPKETDASYSLQEPSEVMDFLQRLVEWKKSIKRQFRVRRRLQVMLIEQVLIEREQISIL